MNKSIFVGQIRSIAYIFLVCLACHWMLLLNDGFLWDDNVYYGLLQGKHYAELSAFLLETGLPLNILFFRGLDLFFGVSNHRVVGFVTIFLSAVLLNSLFRRYAGDFRSLSLVFTSLYLTLFPFKSTVLLCTLVYQVMLLFFIVAVYVRVNFGQHESRGVRLCALAAFSLLSFFSFNTASILVLFYFFLAFEYFSAADFSPAAWSVRSMWAYARKNLVVLLLPIAYWLIKSFFFPTHGLYGHYNKISLDLKRHWDAGWAFFAGLFTLGPVHNVVSMVPSLFLSIALLFLILTAFRWWDKAGLDLPPVRMNRVLLLCWAVAFLVISALPYILVQQGPRFQGWESRHYILFTLSLPVFVLVVVLVYLDRIKTMARAESMGFIFRPLVLCISLVGAASANLVYLDYQLIAIKQWAVVENLKAKPELKRYASFWVNDQIGDFSKTAEFSWYEADKQAFYEWSAIFKKAWGAEKWFANNVNGPDQYYKSVRYGTADIDPDGERCTLVLKNNSASGKSGVARRYFMVKYFGSEVQLQQFLLSIVSIEGCESGAKPAASVSQHFDPILQNG